MEREGGDELFESSDAEQFVCVVRVSGVVGAEVGGQGGSPLCIFCAGLYKRRNFGASSLGFFKAILWGLTPTSTGRSRKLVT